MPKFRLGDNVACITGALEGVDPFTALTVVQVHRDGTVKVQLGDLGPGSAAHVSPTWTVATSELTRVH